MFGLALAMAVAGCGSPQASPESLPTLCKVRPCACQEPNPGLFSSAAEVPIDWSDDGNPSCPPGYVLRRVNT